MSIGTYYHEHLVLLGSQILVLEWLAGIIIIFIDNDYVWVGWLPHVLVVMGSWEGCQWVLSTSLETKFRIIPINQGVNSKGCTLECSRMVFLGIDHEIM